MERFTVHTGTIAPLRRSGVDTDQIIPAEFLKRVSRTGFADGLFASWRKDSRLRARSSGARRRHDPRRRTGLRCRLLSGACGLGLAGPGVPGRRLAALR